ncbi:unnamed protein product [Paramecium octaurelia]|uniref:Uncharacterized protein n=1 Tax=Paramecium octaurelia TaxID=43137 RepID=A0A8S1XEB4_PAROT|nr:unnamed protein product [Paramecium octaurelia]
MSQLKIHNLLKHKRCCNKIVVEFEIINYKDYCKLGDVDQSGNNQSRFEGYENKMQSYKNNLCEMLGISDSKQKKQLMKDLWLENIKHAI